jgi:hypothetical protein
MPEMTLDPRRGYVALPLDVLELDLSPGAFRTLVEFCRMADREGWCWPSLAQLGEKLGRSRAAISGYVSELRESGLVETLRQKTANGFNYRLRFRVTFWADWRARFGGARSPEREAERRVKPAERKVEINHIHKNQSPSDSVGRSGLAEIAAKWRDRVGRTPYPGFDAPPAPQLLQETRLAIAGHSFISADMKTVIARFLQEKGVPCPDPVLSELAVLACETDPAALRTCLAKAWKPHWKRPPSPALFARIADDARALCPAPMLVALLKSYLRRAELAQRNLPSGAISATSFANKADIAPSYPRI